MEMLPLAATAAGTAAAGTAAAGTAASVAGFAGTALKFATILQGVGSVIGGINSNREAKFEAEQMQVNAGQERASSQRAAGEDRRQKNLKLSRLQALSAADGGSASDPTVVDLAGDLEADGEYRALSDLWEGNERARGLETGAAVKKMEGRQALTSGLTGAAGTILANSDTLFDRFGTKKPMAKQTPFGMRTFYG